MTNSAKNATILHQKQNHKDPDFRALDFPTSTTNARDKLLQFKKNTSPHNYNRTSFKGKNKD